MSYSISPPVDTGAGAFKLRKVTRLKPRCSIVRGCLECSFRPAVLATVVCRVCGPLSGPLCPWHAYYVLMWIEGDTLSCEGKGKGRHTIALMTDMTRLEA